MAPAGPAGPVTDSRDRGRRRRERVGWAYRIVVDLFPRGRHTRYPSEGYVPPGPPTVTSTSLRTSRGKDRWRCIQTFQTFEKGLGASLRHSFASRDRGRTLSPPCST
jgi:hypothetical protein